MKTSPTSPSRRMPQATGGASAKRLERMPRGQDRRRALSAEERMRHSSAFVRQHRQHSPKNRPVIWELPADLPVTKREIQMLAALLSADLEFLKK